MKDKEPSDLFSPEERTLIALYRSPQREFRRAVRLTIQYLIGAGMFLAAAILTGEPWYALGTYLTFAAYMLVRLMGARRIGNSMPVILRKYEEELAALRRAAR